MTFTDWRFLFVFLPAVLGLHFLVARLTSRGAAGGRLRFEVANWILVAGGLAFLAAGAGRFAAVLGGAAAGLYLLGRGIAGAHRRPPAVRPDRIGAVPERVSTSAPMARSGLATRSMGRLLKDASPVSSLANGCDASTPASKRMPVPEFPRSNGPSGARNPSRPTPCTRMSPPSTSTSTPRERNADAVARQSSPRRNPFTVLLPSASAPSNAVR